MTLDGVDMRFLRVTAKVHPPADLPTILEKWVLVKDDVTVYISKSESR